MASLPDHAARSARPRPLASRCRARTPGQVLGELAGDGPRVVGGGVVGDRDPPREREVDGQVVVQPADRVGQDRLLVVHRDDDVDDELPAGRVRLEQQGVPARGRDGSGEPVGDRRRWSGSSRGWTCVFTVSAAGAAMPTSILARAGLPTPPRLGDRWERCHHRVNPPTGNVGACRRTGPSRSSWPSTTRSTSPSWWRWRSGSTASRCSARPPVARRSPPSSSAGRT